MLNGKSGVEEAKRKEAAIALLRPRQRDGGAQTGAGENEGRAFKAGVDFRGRAGDIYRLPHPRRRGPLPLITARLPLLSADRRGA